MTATEPAAMSFRVVLALSGMLGLVVPSSAQVFGPPMVLSYMGGAADGGDSGLPQMTTDGSGHWIGVWHTIQPLGGALGFEADIMFSRGRGEAVRPLNISAYADSGYDFAPQVATDGAGRWVAVWTSSESLFGTIDSDYDILVSRSTDDGATWTAPVALNSDASMNFRQDQHPKVATDRAGNWVAVWEAENWFANPLGSDWDLMVSRSSDAGASWTTLATLNTNALSDVGDNRSAQLATDAAGNWVVVWQSTTSLAGTIGEDWDILVSRSGDNGATWSAPVALNANAFSDAVDDYDPSLATDGSGAWVTIWTSYDSLGDTIGADPDILVSRSTDGGATWTAPAALNSTAGGDNWIDWYPHVVTNGTGTWMAAWASNNSLNGTIDQDFDILHAISNDAGGSWSPAAALNTNAASDSGPDLNPRVASDGLGTWVALWESYDTLDGTVTSGNVEIFYSIAGDVCGNGILWAGEECDDGNTLAGDCCSSTCEFETAGAPCGPDGHACTEDVCDGAGTCGIGDDGLCDDETPCTVDICEPGNGCRNVERPRDATECLSAEASRFQLSLGSDTKRSKLSWMWLHGEPFEQADLGSPLVDTNYTLCVYDAVAWEPTLHTSLEIAPSATLWRDRAPGGLQYRDSTGTAEGVTRLQLKTGDAAGTKAQLQGRGSSLPLPPAAGENGYFQRSPSVVVQLHASPGTCWSSQFDRWDMRRNTATKFKAVSD